jgi:thymidine kinase
MFLESNNYGKRKGWIEVICGSMFSGKTEELIRRLKRAEFAKQRVEIFKPSIDRRYHDEEVVSHDSNSIRSTPVSASPEILLLTSEVDVVGIDEAQFFDDELVNVVNELANSGVRVVIAGLDMDYTGRPFGVMPKLMSVAEYVTKVHAICVDCGELAQFSYRTSENEQLVLLGEVDHYRPLCRKCYNRERESTS